MMDTVPKCNNVSFNFPGAVFSLSWISRLLKMGLIGCSEMIVRN